MTLISVLTLLPRSSRRWSCWRCCCGVRAPGRHPRNCSMAWIGSERVLRGEVSAAARDGRDESWPADAALSADLVGAPDQYRHGAEPANRANVRVQRPQAGRGAGHARSRSCATSRRTTLQNWRKCDALWTRSSMRRSSSGWASRSSWCRTGWSRCIAGWARCRCWRRAWAISSAC